MEHTSKPEITALLQNNPHLSAMAKRAQTAGRFHHAYLFWGANDLLLQQAAEWFAKGMLCKGLDPPCFSCVPCQKIQQKIHPDIITVEAQEGKSTISIDTMREIRRSCVVKPNESAYKIYLILQLAQLTPGAMAAFLKTLEQPPEHVVFLLTTTEMSMLPKTIQSRVLSVPVAAFDSEDGAQASRGERADPPEGAQAEAFFKALLQQDEYRMLCLVARYEKNKAAVVDFLAALSSVLGQALRTTSMPTKRCLYSIALVQSCKEKLGNNQNSNLLLSYLCAQLCLDR